jgi:hypothetical protein
VIDTLVLARRQHAGGPTLDDLCSRYGVNRSRRTQYGELLDAELLAAVYVQLTTTRQAALQLEPIKSAPASFHTIVRTRPQPLPPRVAAEERTAHRAFVKILGSDAVWFDYFTIKSVAADALAICRSAGTHLRRTRRRCHGLARTMAIACATPRNQSECLVSEPDRKDVNRDQSCPALGRRLWRQKRA